MLSQVGGLSCVQNIPGLGSVGGSAVCNQEELVGLDCGLVFQNAVFGYANAVEAGSKSAQPSHGHRALQAADYPRRYRSGHKDLANARHPKECGAEQKSPQPAPERAHLAPGLHAVSGIVVTHHLVIGAVILADNGQLLHVEPSFLEFLDSLVSRDVRIVDGNHGVGIGHSFPLFRSSWVPVEEMMVFTPIERHTPDAVGEGNVCYWAVIPLTIFSA